MAVTKLGVLIGGGQMKIENKDGCCTFFLEGRIDTNNAPQVEEEIFSAMKDVDVKTAVIDAERLEYISSAGLRVLMKLRKTIGQALPMINVSRDVYDILETTGFTELLDVKKAYRKVSIEGCEVIGEGGHGKVYRLDDETIIKVYRESSALPLIEKEREYAKNAFIKGVPSAIAYDTVKTEEGYGVVFEMAGATTVSKTIMNEPERLPELAAKMGSLLKTLNTTEADPALFGDIREIYLQRAKAGECFFTDDENKQIVRMIDAIPESGTMVHGDFHPNNVMVQQDGELMLIDMADISRGDPIYDIGGTFLTMCIAGSQDHSVTEQVIGLKYEYSTQAWGILLSSYYGTTDPAKLELINNRCAAFALLRMATTLSMNSANKSRYDDVSGQIVAALRQQLFPNTENFCRLLAMTM